MHGLMSGDWKRGTVSGPQRLQLYAWTAPDLSTTAPALDSDPRRELTRDRHLLAARDDLVGPGQRPEYNLFSTIVRPSMLALARRCHSKWAGPATRSRWAC